MIKFKLSLIIVFVLAIQNISFSQTNVDFETGNLTGWTGYIGANMNSTVSFTPCSTAVNPPLNGTNLNMIVKSYFSMMTPAAPVDPYGLFGLTSPLGGSNVIRLGNENTNVNEGGDCTTPKNCAGTGPAYCSTICGTPVGSSYIECPAEAITQTFAVTSANALFTYAYAAVLNDGNHAIGEEPYFEIKVYNQSGTELTCFTKRVIQKAGVTTPGWTKSAKINCWYPVNPGSDVYYKSWTTGTMLLSSYIGQNVTVRFAVAGCVDGAHFGYAYFDSKTDPVAITTSNASPCGGQTVTLTAPAGVAGAYSWSGPGIVSGGATATVTVNAAGTYTLSVPASSTGTCTATMTASVTYSGGPSVTANAASPTICPLQSTVLTAGGATTYTWSANAGSATTSTVNVSPGSTTIYTVTGTTAGCSSTQTVQVTVTPTPTLTISGTTTICNGASTVLTAGTSAGTYTWSGNAGGGSASTVTVTPGLGTTNYTLSGSNSGCPGTNTIAVTVNPNPTVTITGPTTHCSGSAMTLTASTTAGTYTWSTGPSTSTISVNPGLGNTTYTLNGSNGTCLASTTITVSVTATPTLAVNSPTICAGQSTVLTAASANSYSWSTTATTNTISVSPGVGTTTYVVTGDNGAGCTAAKTATVTVVAQPTVSIAGATTNCSGIAMTLTASTTAGTYTWSTGPSTSTVSVNPGLGNTTYTLNGSVGTCTASTTITVSVTATPTLAVNSPTICAGQSAVLTAASASSYSWSTTATTNTISVSPGIGTTTYVVTGDNGAGCTTSKTATVTVAAQPTVSIAGATTNCSGTAMTLTASTTAGTYTWSTGPSTSTISVNPGVGNTTYTLNGSVGTCTASTTITVSVTATPTLNVNSATICSGQSTVLTANTANTYTWNTTANTNTISVSPASTTVYTVTGDDGNGCTVVKTATVTVNPTPTISITGAHVICSGQSITLTGGTATSYTWLPSGTNTATLSVTPPSGSNSYTLNGANGTCTATATALVDVSPSPTISVNSASICSGQTTTLTANGAATYSWSANAGGVISPSVTVNPTTTTVYTVGGITGSCVDSTTVTVTVSPTPTLSLPANSYTVCIGNSVGLSVSGATTYTWTTGTALSCTACANPISTPTANVTYTVQGTTGSCISAAATVTVSINVNPLPTLTLTPSSAALCSSNSSTITATGASTYTWSPSGSLSSATGATVTATPGSTTDYTVTGTDVNGCTNTTNVTVTVTPTPTLNISPVPPAACAGQSVILTGGTATTYTWSANAGSVNTSSVSVTPAANTTYTLTGSTGSCTASAVATVTVNAAPVIGSASVTAAPCGLSTGCINSVSVSGGNPAYQYSWNNGATWSASSTNCNVPAGSYTVEVKDVNGCSDTTVVSVGNIGAPPAPTVSVSANAVCIGSTVALSVTTPSAGIQYTWTDATGTHTGTTYTITNINPAGNYSVSVTATDMSSTCQSSATTTVITVNALPNVTVVATQTTICSSQSTVLTASGASTYTWSANAGGVSTNTVSVNPTANTTYTVTGDNAGCISTQTININVNATPTVSANSSGNICTGQTATLTASGATNYTWTPGGATTTTISVTPASTTTYVVTGDDLGCSTTQTVVLTVAVTPTLTAVASQTTICSNQTATLTASGATNYTWTPGGTGGTITVTPAGTTTYVVTGDNGGCSSTQTVSINVNPSPTVSIAASSPAICAGQTATFTASGATNYSWTPGGTGSSISVSPTGNATYTVTGDLAGCTSTQTVSINVNALPVLSSVGNQVVCSGGTINPIVFLGASTVNWTNTNASIGIASSGTGNISGYTAPSTTITQTGIVVATPSDNVTGCVGLSQTFTITVYPTPTVSGGTADTAKCGLLNGGVHGINVSGGTFPIHYQWYDSTAVLTGDTSLILSGVGTGTYSVLIKDANGCTAIGSSTIFSVPFIAPVVVSISPHLSQGTAPLSVTFTSTVTGATSYNWSFGNGIFSNTQNPTAVTYTAPGTYSVTLIATNGTCQAKDTAIVIIDAPVSIIIPNIYSPNGDGINDEWFITCVGIQYLHCDIFNRWGTLVYQLLAPNDVWSGVMNNGNHATDGTYFYILDATGYDGKTYKSHGSLTLVK